MIIDAGGGTVDVGTYKIESARPLQLLRLAEEVVKPQSKSVWDDQITWTDAARSGASRWQLRKPELWGCTH